MRPCIGIISYLPEEPELRRIRQSKLELLLNRCNSLFYLPIIVVAQNWTGQEVIPINTIVYHYDKLGITKARQTLRQHFLDSEYDYLIMLDDDCEIVGTEEDARQYLRCLEAHPSGYGIFKGTLLKLFAISKDVFAQYSFPEGEAEKGEIFEDIYFVSRLIKEIPEKGYNIKTNLKESSDSAKDPYSTWFKGQFIKKDIGDKTRAALKEI